MYVHVCTCMYIHVHVCTCMSSFDHTSLPTCMLLTLLALKLLKILLVLKLLVTVSSVVGSEWT